MNRDADTEKRQKAFRGFHRLSCSSKASGAALSAAVMRFAKLQEGYDSGGQGEHAANSETAQDQARQLCSMSM
jgi:hypothetical protein